MVKPPVTYTLWQRAEDSAHVFHPPQHQRYWESGCVMQAFPEEGKGLQGVEPGVSVRWNTTLGDISAVSGSSFHTYKWKEREGRFRLTALWATAVLTCLSLSCRPSPRFLSSLSTLG